MKRWLWLVGLLALLATGAWWWLQQAFPPQRIAELVSAEVSARSGRDFRIQGRLDWRLLPRLAIVAEDLVLANAPWGSQPDMLRVRRAALQLALWPLLQGKVQVDSVALDGIDLLLETDAKGRGNWPTPAAAPGADKGPATPGGPRAFALDRLQLSELRLAYLNGASRQRHELLLKQLELQREAQGYGLNADWLLAQRRWQATGQLGAIEALLANATDWPATLQLRSDGARIDIVALLRHGPPPRRGRIDIDATLSTAAALTPWLDNASALPLPMTLKTSLALGAESLQAEPLQLSLAGQVVNGRATLRNTEPWQLQAQLAAKAVDFRRLAPQRGATGEGARGERKKLFDDTSLPFDKLPRGNAQIELSIEQLSLPELPPLSGLKTRLKLRPGALTVESLDFGLAGGQVHGSLVLSEAAGSAPRLKLQLDANALSAPALARAAGHGDALGSGQLQLKTGLAMTGSSPRALAASASGELLLSAQGLTLAAGAAPIGPNLLPRLLEAMSPQHKAGRSIQVDCAVVRLPFDNGVAQVARTIAVETPELAISAAGRVDLRDETLALAFRPTTKVALGLNTAQLASLVMVKGPLLEPKFTLDPKGAAELALSLGAAMATGGMSMLGQQLLKPSGDLHPCQYAATGVEAAPKGDAAAQPKAPPAPQKALPDLLRRIFK